MGLVLFEMREREVVHCMVSECALRNCAQLDGEADNEVENLFFFYQRKVETIASRQFGCGFKNPIVRTLDLAPHGRS